MSLPKTIPFDQPKTIPFSGSSDVPQINNTPQPNPNGATFQSSGNEGIISGALKTVGNIPSSAINFVKGAVSSLNPINTFKNLAQIPQEFHALVQESGGIGDALKATSKEILPTAYGALVPQATRQIIAGDFQGARKTLQEDPVGQILPYLLVAKQTAEKAGYGEQFDQGISKIANPLTKTGETLGSGIKGASGGSARFLAGQLTGLSPNTIQNILSNPQEFSKSAQADITRPNLADNIGKAIDERQTNLTETGSGYQSIRTQTTPIQVDPNYLSNLIKEKTGLNIKSGSIDETTGQMNTGSLETSGSASVRLPTDVNALQNKLYNTWQPEFAKGYLTPDEYLNFRSDLSKLAYNDSGIGKSTTLSDLAEKMRSQANTDLRPQVPGLTELDKQFSPQITELNNLSKGLVDKNGHLSDTAINRIANATGKGKDPFLARLEELAPGITDKIKILKAVEDIQNSREVKTGTYLRAGALGAGLVTLNPYLIVTSIASIPEIAVPLLRGLGYTGETISKISNTLGISKIHSAINKIPTTLNKEVIKKK